MATSISNEFFTNYKKEDVKSVRLRMAHILSDGHPVIHPQAVKKHLKNLKHWMSNQKPLVCACSENLVLDPTTEDTIYLLQPTRVIGRKRIEKDIELIDALLHHQNFRKEFDNNPGTYYLTKGWLKSGSDPLREYEALVEKYGSKKADWLMDMQYKNYKRLVLVAHSQNELDTYRPRALEVAEYCERWGMKYEEILGSDLYIRLLVEGATTLSESDDSFLLISPESTIQQRQFIQWKKSPIE